MPEGRYDRQIGLPELGNGGQKKLAAAHITVVGAGGLGSSLLFSLAGIGVKNLRIIDHDTISLSNLNRQFLYTPADIGLKKAEQAASRLAAYNPDLILEVFVEQVDAANIYELIQGSDLVIICVDSTNIRYLLNDACCRLGISYIDGAVNAFFGYVSYIIPGRSACYSCQNGVKYQADRTEGNKAGNTMVMGTIPAVIGAMQAQLAVSVVLDCSHVIPGYRYYYNGKDQSIDIVKHRRDPGCLCCGAADLIKDGDTEK